jgi:hypothetical protein
MSGSAALSAAKNRRTSSSTNPPQTKHAQQKVDSGNAEKLDVPKNPLQILYIHEIRLNKLEVDINNHDTHDKNKIDTTNNENEAVIKTLSNKITLLEQQMSALKDELSKIMSFAMETNRAFLLYKTDKEQQQNSQFNN